VVEAVRRLCALFLICTHSVHFRVSSRLWLCHTAMEVDRPQVPLGALPTAQWLQCNDLVDRDETFLTRLIRKQVSDLQFEVKLCVRKLQGTHAPITKQTAAWLLRRERRSSARECSVLPCRLLATRAQVLPGTSSDVGCMPHCCECHTAYSTVPSARRAPVCQLGSASYAARPSVPTVGTPVRWAAITHSRQCVSQQCGWSRPWRYVPRAELPRRTI
jgi:hypothetical protein